MRKVFLAAALVLAGPVMAALVGCGGGPKSPEQKKTDISTQLPTGTKVLEDRGNGWWLIEIKNKKYLYHSYGYRSNCATETIVEVKE